MFLGALVGIAGVGPRSVVALWSGFGSDRSKEPAVQIWAGHVASREAFLAVLPDPLLLLVVGVGDEPLVDGV